MRTIKNPYIIYALESRYGNTSKKVSVLNETVMPPLPKTSNPKKQTIYGAFTGGFQKSYDANKDFSPQEIQAYENLKSQIDPAIKKAYEIAKTLEPFLKKWGIVIPFAVVAIAAFLLGGFVKIPMALVIFGTQRLVSGAMSHLIGLKHGHDHKESFSFNDYYKKRLLEEGLYDRAVDFAGGSGQFLGAAAGTARKYFNAATNAVASVVGSVVSSVGNTLYGIIDAFKADPKAASIHAAKLAIVIVVSALSGGVAATAYELLTNPQNWPNIVQSVVAMGLGSPEEVTKTLAQGVGDHAHQGAADALHGAVSSAADHAHGTAATAALSALDQAHDAAHAAHDAYHHLEPSHIAKHIAGDAAIDAKKKLLKQTPDKSLQAILTAGNLAGLA
jgi:hypothetical protein